MIAGVMAARRAAANGGRDGAGFCYPTGSSPRRLAAPPVSVAAFASSVFNWRSAVLAGRQPFRSCRR